MVKSSKIIGGEFPIYPQYLNHSTTGVYNFDGCYMYSSGRSALYYILLDVKARYGIKKVLFPDYLCSSVIVAAKSAEMQVVFYEINEQLKINRCKFANIYQVDSAVLIINYFGLQDLSNDVAFVRSLNSNAIIIEDDVQAFYEYLQNIGDLNYKFTSLRKTFSCPDGGLVKSSHRLPHINESNEFYQYKLAGGILKSFSQPEYYKDDIFMHLLEQGESLINNDISKGISKVAVDILSTTDIEDVSKIRRSNAQIIIEGLNAIGIKTILPLPKNKTPLFIPLYLDERNKVRRSLFQHNVFCPVHWPLDGLQIKKGVEMAEHEMSIVVDQRYNESDMLFVLDLIEKVIK